MLPCTYCTAGWCFAFGRVVSELEAFVALGCFIKFEIGCDSEAVPKEEHASDGFSGAVAVHYREHH